MKNFISGLFKKKETGSAPAADTKPAPETKTEAKAPAGVKAPAPKTEPEPVVTPPFESKVASTPPPLKPLYDKKDESPAAAPEPALPPHQHLPFEGELQAVIQTLVDDLGDVYPQTFEQWEDGFRRDENPEQEIAAWTHVAAVLKAMTIQFSFALLEKKECFDVLIACFTGARETVRVRAKPKLLSADQVDQAIRYFYEGGY